MFVKKSEERGLMGSELREKKGDRMVLSIK
jgi:hypothetical protein